jgi:hypothetical protein
MQESMRCRVCGSHTYFARPDVRHKLHMWLTLATLGFWLPIWFLNALPGTVRCATCGANIGTPFDRMAVMLFVAMFAYFYLLLWLQPFRC